MSVQKQEMENGLKLANCYHVIGISERFLGEKQAHRAPSGGFLLVPRGKSGSRHGNY